MKGNQNIVIDEWIALYLNTPDLNEYITGATVKKLNQIQIPFPPLSEQKRLVKYLDAIAERATVIQTAQGQTSDKLTLSNRSYERTLKESCRYSAPQNHLNT